MDSKNVIAAIALSTAVIVLYSLFFLPDQSTKTTVYKYLFELMLPTPYRFEV